MNLDYLGGVFDCKGYITVTTTKSRNQKRYYLQICLGGFSENHLIDIKDNFGYGSVQCHGKYHFRYYTASKSAYNLACTLVNFTNVKKLQLQYAILYYLEMSRLGKLIRSAGRYNPTLVPKLRNDQEITHNYFKEKMFNAG